MDETTNLSDGDYETTLGNVTVADGKATLDCVERWENEEDVPSTLDVGGTTVELRPDTILVAQPKDGSRKRVRLHHGLIAQEVEQALQDLGLDNSHFGGIQHHSHNGGEDVYSLGYTELIGPLIRAVQELKAEGDAIKAELDAKDTEHSQELDAIRARLDALES